jgi:hypothetical protein
MTRFRVICVFCTGESVLPADQIELIEDEDEGPGYRFDCQACRRHNAKIANEQLIALLLEGGVRWGCSEEERRDAIVAAFHEQLDDDRAFARFVYG